MSSSNQTASYDLLPEWAAAITYDTVTTIVISFTGRGVVGHLLHSNLPETTAREFIENATSATPKQSRLWKQIGSQEIWKI